jgi:hypothetical protein
MSLKSPGVAFLGQCWLAWASLKEWLAYVFKLF